ncbi:MAG: YjbQ family protein [Bacteroidales bacterium]|nr:YjbQ family protein [Bacteroidales bacterium]
MTSHTEIVLPSFGRGFHLIDSFILDHLPGMPESGVLHLFIQHTSAGLMINENADPAVRLDFETVMNRLAPENLTAYTHNLEGSDDMPAHIKSAITGHSVTIPIIHGRLYLGTWQGIYLCEFRNRAQRRKIIASIVS